jgi:LmbE family N-acetylglucosaminyl deacetylase
MQQRAILATLCGDFGRSMEVFGKFRKKDSGVTITLMNRITSLSRKALGQAWDKLGQLGLPAAGVVLCLIAFASLAKPQVRPVNDYGALGLARLIKQLQTTGSVMMIGAHPDDEDSALLAHLARGENARTAYLSLTRGDGGQNIIGPELFEPLGVIRTEELLQARRLDGAEQYFTRAFDYGFSKTLAEARSKWDEKVIICDAAVAIRKFRPLVVISRFSGTPRDGHGQHQYAGYISPLAVKAAADPQQCTGSESGEPWTVKKLYIETGFNDNAGPTLKVNTGTYDPVLGRTYFEIAMEGRSMHRSQGEGRLEFRGDQFSGLNLVGADKDKREQSIFDGIDTSVKGIGTLADEKDPALAGKLAALEDSIDKAARMPLLVQPHGTVAMFAEIYRRVADTLSVSKTPAAYIYLNRIRSLAASGMLTAAGIQIDALADRDSIAPDESVGVAVRTYSSQPQVTVKEVQLRETCRGVDWGGCGVVRIEKATSASATSLPRREIAKDEQYFKLTGGTTLFFPTQPYWLRRERTGGLFDWSDQGMIRQDEKTLPFSPPLVVADIKLDIAGVEIDVRRPIEYRFPDPARGEIRTEIDLVPAVTLALDKDVLIVPASDRLQTRRVVVTVTNNSVAPAAGKVALAVEGIKVLPEAARFDLKRHNETKSIVFDLAIPWGTQPQNGRPVRMEAHIFKEPFSSQSDLRMNVVAYPHIQMHRYYTVPRADLRIVDLKTMPANVGYVMGSGDEVPEAIRQMGMSVTELNEQELASGDLAKYDTIVIGIRASETRPDLVANNTRLLDYVRVGGTVIMQYQRNNFVQSGLAPYKIDTTDKQGTTAGSIARVVDENAPVKILEPLHAVFNFPNKISEADFNGWVQERNAYNLVTFDPQYTPLLESHDAGEQENKGGLVIAKVGKGNWVYCSYSFFRQLPAGVPGAYRLFANLLSLPRAK